MRRAASRKSPIRTDWLQDSSFDGGGATDPDAAAEANLARRDAAGGRADAAFAPFAPSWARGSAHPTRSDASAKATNRDIPSIRTTRQGRCADRQRDFVLRSVGWPRSSPPESSRAARGAPRSCCRTINRPSSSTNFFRRPKWRRSSSVADLPSPSIRLPMTPAPATALAGPMAFARTRWSALSRIVDQGRWDLRLGQWVSSCEPRGHGPCERRAQYRSGPIFCDVRHRRTHAGKARYAVTGRTGYRSRPILILSRLKGAAPD